MKYIFKLLCFIKEKNLKINYLYILYVTIYKLQKQKEKSVIICNIGDNNH